MSARNTYPIRRCRRCARRRRGHLNVCISCQRQAKATERAQYRDDHPELYRHTWKAS